MAMQTRKPVTTVPKAPAPPEGFTSARRKRADGFAIREPGNVFLGALLGRYRRPSRGGRPDRYYYLVRLSSECPAKVPVDPEATGDEREYRDGSLKAGQILSVDESADLRIQISELAESDTLYEVWCRCEAKEDIGDGQSLWRYTVYTKRVGLKADADIPF